MNEVIFLVEEAPEGGFTARALGQSIFTEGYTTEQLHANIRDAVTCHFEEGNVPSVANRILRNHDRACPPQPNPV